MPEYSCNCCLFKTEIKTHYARHLKTEKHRVMSEHRDIEPPTEVERLKARIEWLCKKNKELIEKIKVLEKR